MSRYQKRLSLGLCVLLLLAQALCPALAEGIPSKNPLLHPMESVPEVQTEHEYFNLLLLGIDFGDRGYRGSGGKNVFSDCHTDAVLVASLDKTEQRLRLISLPRDTLTYVPGVMGIYKLNAAINCADTTDEGLQRIQDAASWLLGGVKIDRYCAVDMNAMIEIGDLIGGVDLDVEATAARNTARACSIWTERASRIISVPAPTPPPTPTTSAAPAVSVS